MSNRVLNIVRWSASVACISATLLAGGCGSFNRPYPDKALFAIDLGTPPGNSGELAAASFAADNLPPRPCASPLRVRSMRIAKPFDATGFVYKVAESRFTSDYYNGFIADPDRLLTGGLVNWLAASGELGSVVEEGSTADYRLTLESNVTELYGDYTNKDAPQAIMELRVFVIDDVPSPSRIIFQKTYREVQPLPDNTPEKLVRGWEEAYRRILTQLLLDLRASPQVANAELGSQSR